MKDNVLSHCRLAEWREIKDKIRENDAGHFWTSDVVGNTQEASIFSLEVNYLIRIDQGWLTSVSVLPQNKSRQIAACYSAMCRCEIHMVL